MDAPEPPTDHQKDSSPARVAAEKVIRAYERSVGAVHAVHRPILLEILTLGYEAAIERAVRVVLQEFLGTMLLTPSAPAPSTEEPDPNALDVHPLNPEGPALAGKIELNEEGGFNFRRE